MKSLESLAVYWTWRQLTIVLLGFASGLPLLLTLGTLSVWLKEEGISKTAIGLFAIVGMPYSLKFLWAPVIDHGRIPLLTRWLGRRRGWTLLIQVLLMTSIVVLGSIDPQTNLFAVAVAALAVAFFSASQDIVIDAYRIDILDDDAEQGAGAASIQVGYRVGMLGAGAGALFLAESIPWRWVYAIEGALLVVGMVTILLAPEPGGVERGAAPKRASVGWHDVVDWFRRAVIEPFADFMRHPGWAAILLFILLFKFGDAFIAIMANPFYLEMGFTKTEIAEVSKIFGMLATLGGVFLGGVVVYRLGVLKGLFVCGLLQMLSNLVYCLQAVVGHDLHLLILTIGVENVAGGMGSAAFVAYMSSLCSSGFTGTQYALLSSLMSVGRTVLSASSGWLADQVGWVTFFAVSTAVALPGMVLLVWMMRAYPHQLHPEEAAL